MQLYDKKSILIDLKKHKSFLDKNIEKYIKTLDAPKEISSLYLNIQKTYNNKFDEQCTHT